MYKRKARRSKRPLVIGTILGLLILGGIAFFIFRHNDSNAKITANKGAAPVNTVNYSPSTSQDNSTNNQRKSSPSKAATTLDNGATAPSSTSNKSLQVIITTARSTGSNGTHSVTVAGNVSGATSGTCTFTATQSGGPSASQTSTVEASNQNYICPATTITVPAAGNWNISATLSSGGQTGSPSSWAGGAVAVN
jgi:cytoskeletal protein RodZ